MFYKEKKKKVCKMNYHKDVYKQKTKKVCKINFNCQKDSSWRTNHVQKGMFKFRGTVQKKR